MARYGADMHQAGGVESGAGMTQLTQWEIRTGDVLLVDVFDLLVEFLTICKDVLIHFAPIGAAALTGLLTLFVFAERKDSIGLFHLLNKIWAYRLNKTGRNGIRGIVHTHNLLGFKAALTLVYPVFSVKAATKHLLDKLKYWVASHSYLHPLMIGGAVNIGTVSHSPCRLLDSSIALAVNYSGDVGNLFFLCRGVSSYNSYTTERR